jgi:hypothetical protein
MVCALRLDRPTAGCRGIPAAVAAGVLVGVVGLVLFGLHRRRPRRP